MTTEERLILAVAKLRDCLHAYRVGHARRAARDDRGYDRYTRRDFDFQKYAAEVEQVLDAIAPGVEHASDPLEAAAWAALQALATPGDFSDDDREEVTVKLATALHLL